MNEGKYIITRHAKERYAERIMDKSDLFDINKFIAEHEDKIDNDINKMIEHGEFVYSGKQAKDGKTSNIKVLMQNCWVVLIDSDTSKVITLYKIDLHCEDEKFTQMYVDKMKALLASAQDEYEKAKEQQKEEVEQYRAIIADNNSLINEYKSYIRNLEETNEAYQQIIDNCQYKLRLAERKSADVINNLIRKKAF